MDEGSPVDIIYLDFQKAFDKVPHQRLILKLKSHGLGISSRPYSKLDRAMAYRQDTMGSIGWRGFKLEIRFEWSTSRICTRAYLISNVHKFSRRRGNKQNIEICG